jgi:hypothetical protein
MIRGEIVFAPVLVYLNNESDAPRPTTHPLPRHLSCGARLEHIHTEAEGKSVDTSVALGDRSRAADMSRTTRPREFVDLTTSTPTRNRRNSTPPSFPHPPIARHTSSHGHGAENPARGIKRRHDECDGHAESSASASTRQRQLSIEILDMTGEGATEVPTRRTAPPIPAHQPVEPAENNPLLAYRCPICLDRPENPTSTICGTCGCGLVAESRMHLRRGSHL